MRRWIRRWWSDDEPIIGLSEQTTQRLHWFAFVWSLVAVAVLHVAGRFDRLDTLPGRSAYPITIQPVFMALFGVAVVIAWRWEIVGGTVAAFTASGLAMFAADQLVIEHAVAVVLALLVPGVVWIVIDLHDFRPRVAAVAVVLIGGAVVSGAAIAHDAYDELYGPSHPQSSTVTPDLPVEWVWVGAVSDRAATVMARVPDADAPTLELAAAGGNSTDHVVVGQETRDDVYRFAVDGLLADTTYEYRLRPSPDAESGEVGHFETFPDGPSSFTFAVSSCARTGSNGAVFDAIAALDPALYIVTGDLHYANIADGDRDEMADVMDLTLSRPAPAALYRSTPIAYVWDDHDFGGDGSDRTSASRNAVIETYRSSVPHYDLHTDTGSIHQAFTIGRVRFVLTDVRSERSPTTTPDSDDKTMLGAEQRAWLEAELASASKDHALVVWVNPVPWISAPETGADHWGGYPTERRDLATFIESQDIDNLLMVSGDAHMLAIDDGSNSGYGAEGEGFPVVHAAALDRPGRVKGGPYSEGAIGGSGQFAAISVVDDGGATITVEIEGRDWTGDVLLSHVVTVQAPDASAR